MFIYLAQAIDLSKNSPDTDTIVNDVCEMAGKLGCITFLPAKAYSFWPEEVKTVAGYKPVIEQLIGLNYTALARSDLAVFVWDGSPTWGMQLEFQFVVERKKSYVFLDLSDGPTPIYLSSLLKLSTLMAANTEVPHKNLSTILGRMVRRVESQPAWRKIKIYYYLGRIRDENTCKEN